jgi:hypothetical protein
MRRPTLFNFPFPSTLYPMSKKKAQFYSISLLSKNRPYATVNFYDRKERKMLSSVDVVLNLEYHDESDMQRFLGTR